MDENLKKYIEQIPKAELHVHLEGTFEPELMFEIAQRNHMELRYKSVDELRDAYKFSNLQDFLDIYYAATGVLLYEQDFYDLTMAYLRRAHADNVVHTEMFFDPQTHAEHGVNIDTVVGGISHAMADAKSELGISSKLILCFLRHLSEQSAMQTLQSALKHTHKIVAIGLDSSENGNPPSKFFNVFNRVRAEGFFVVAHAGEEGPADYVWEAIDLLEVERIDHGIRSIDDADLMNELCDRQIALTVCPLSNLKLQVVRNLSELPVKSFLEKGIRITLNSDDPAYFDGYVNDNYLQMTEALNLTRNDIYTLAENSFSASFITENERNIYLEKLNDFDQAFG